MTIVSLDPSDANGLTSSSREEQMTAHVSACFGLYSKIRKQKTRNTYFAPKRCPVLLIASLLPAAAAQMGREQPCPAVAMSSQHRLRPFPRRCRGVAREQQQLSVRRCFLSVLRRAAITAKFETRWCGKSKSWVRVYWNWFGIFEGLGFFIQIH